MIPLRKDGGMSLLLDPISHNFIPYGLVSFLFDLSETSCLSTMGKIGHNFQPLTPPPTLTPATHSHSKVNYNAE